MQNDIFELMVQCELPELHFHQDTRSGLKAIIAIHDSSMGPALGGCRCLPYESTKDAIIDAALLAEGMTLKAALAGIPFGGGKAVIIDNPSIVDRQAMLMAFAEFLESLNGRYITAVDSGTSSDDMDVLAQYSHFVTSTHAGGNPSPHTAEGVLIGIKCAVLHRLQLSSLEGVHVAIQGLGQVGFHLAEKLHEAGATLTISDLNPERAKHCKRLFGATVVNPSSVHRTPCDVFAPCALGGVINQQSVAELNCAVIAGSANNQLAQREMNQMLADRNILYAPDFAINSGGLIYVASSHQHINLNRIEQKIQHIQSTLKHIFDASDQTGMPTNDVATALAKSKLASLKLNNPHTLGSRTAKHHFENSATHF